MNVEKYLPEGERLYSDERIKEAHPGLWQPDGPAGRRTACCPMCAIDAVIGDGGGFPVTDPHFKARCARTWFNGYARMEDDCFTVSGSRILP